MIKKLSNISNKNLIIICAFISFIQNFINFYLFKNQINSISSNQTVIYIAFAIISIGQLISFIVTYLLIPYLLASLVNFWKKEYAVDVSVIRKCLYSSYLISIVHVFINILLIALNVDINIYFYKLIYMNISAIIVNLAFFILLKKSKVLTFKAAIISIAMFLIYFANNLLIIDYRW